MTEDLSGEETVIYEEKLKKVRHFQTTMVRHFRRRFGSNRDTKVETNISNSATSEVIKQQILIHHYFQVQVE